MKKIINLIALVIILILAGVTIIRMSSPEDNWICQNGQWIKHGHPNLPKPTTGCTNETTNNDWLTISTDCQAKQGKWLADYKECEAISQTWCAQNKGQFEECASACRHNSQAEICTLQCVPVCKFTTTPSGADAQNNNPVNVFSPLPGQIINGIVAITGQARGYWFFEASFPIKIIDDKNKELATCLATAQADWMTENFVPFTASLVMPATSASSGFIIFQKDNPSGLPANDASFSLPVKFIAEELMTVKVFFGNLQDGGVDCNQVHETSRSIAKTKEVARAALEQLLLGPTELEKQQDLFTSINPGVKIQSLTITDGLAKVDFDKTLEEAVGGSCRVAAIRNQITQTLKQFPTIKNVLISIDGRTEDILQP